jgi:hypothetical protein
MPTHVSSATLQDGAGSVSERSFGKHLAARDLASIWGLDETTIRRMFQDEPGVFKIGREGRRDGKRDYVTLRIPEAVALRVYEKRSR